jgi:hypothetical protein
LYENPFRTAVESKAFTSGVSHRLCLLRKRIATLEYQPVAVRLIASLSNAVHARLGLGRNGEEVLSAKIPEQMRRFSVTHMLLHALDLIFDMTVGDENQVGRR